MIPHSANGRRAAAVAAVLSVALLAPALAGAGKAQNGLYKGAGTNTHGGVDKVKIKFRVAKGGKRIKKLRAKLIVHCPALGFHPFIEVPMPAIKVKRNGRFSKRIASEPGLPGQIKVGGKLVGTKVKKGTFSYQSRLCQRGVPEPIRWKAKRVRR